MQQAAQAAAPMEYGIAAYLRNLSLQLDKIGRKCPDATTHEALVKICIDLADKAHMIETTFRVPKIRV
jgi:hypothetical protein